MKHLHMIRMELDTRGVGRYRQLPARVTDIDYRVHAVLKGLFQDKAPRPFFIAKNTSSFIVVLGYSLSDAETLTDIASLADPEALGVLNQGTLVSKLMPLIPEGKQVRFDVRLQPTYHSFDTRDQDAFYAPGIEAESREDAYAQWTTKKLSVDGAVSVPMAHVTGWDLTTRERRAGRSMKRHTLPEAHVCGVLRVEDPKAFTGLLAAGIGRGRGFGFGMLRLSPAL